jgi:hypothetical protein
VSDEIVVRLRHIFMEPTDDDLQDVTEQAADEIERLRADLAAERALADQLAEWLLRIVPDEDRDLNDPLMQWEARREA